MASTWSWVTNRKVRAERGLQVLQLRAQRLAQLGVEVRQRLVHQEHRRVAHDRPADRHPLHLAAREPVGLAVEQVPDPQHLRRPRDPPLDLVGRRRCAPPTSAGTPGSAAPCSAGRASSTGRPAPRRAAPRSSRAVSSPPIETVPASGISSPAISRSVVVLPAPVGPSSTKNSPSAMVSVSSSTARVPAEALADALQPDLSHAPSPISSTSPVAASKKCTCGASSARPDRIARRPHEAARGARLEVAARRA